MNKHAIAFSVDDNYMHYAIALLKSLIKHETRAVIYVRGVNLKQANIDCLKSIGPNINIIPDNMQHLNSRKVLMKKLLDPEELFWTYSGNVFKRKGVKNIIKTMYSELAAYSCHSRFKTICELITEHDTVLCLDADAVVNKNFDHIFELDTNDLYVVPYGEEQQLFHNEGLLLVNNTNNSKQFFENVKQRLFDEQQRWLDWDADTQVLTDVYNNKKISIGHLDDVYKDKKHLHESYMWSGDGPRKQYKTFQQRVDESND